MSPSTLAEAPPASPPESSRSYGRGAKVLSIGIGSTGLVTFAYFAVASHVLSDLDYKQISMLWSVMFVITAVIYRPIEQLLSRTIAERRAEGLEHSHPTRLPMAIQAAFASTFLVLALIFRGPIENGLFSGSAALYWILVAGVLAYAVSYFARGWLAGHQWFGLYGGLVFLEGTSRLLFALAVAVGIAEGQSIVGLGIAAAPFVSLMVLPFAFARGRKVAPNTTSQESPSGSLTFSRGGKFAALVLVVMFSEQVLLNAAVLTANGTSANKAVVGYIFNALLIARAPLQLFQAIQGSLLPHLSGLNATSDNTQFKHAIRVTVLAILAFGLALSAGLLLIGPFVMDLLFDNAITYGRFGLVFVGLGMTAHLIAGTFNQAALARDKAGLAAVAWLVSAGLFVVWMFTSVIEDQLLRAEVGYFGGATVLCALLWGAYRRG